MRKYTPTPWDDNAAVILPGGYPIPITGEDGEDLGTAEMPCRVITEPKYQHAKRCVNAFGDLLIACKALVDSSYRHSNGELIICLHCRAYGHHSKAVRTQDLTHCNACPVPAAEAAIAKAEESEA